MILVWMISARKLASWISSKRWIFNPRNIYVYIHAVSDIQEGGNITKGCRMRIWCVSVVLYRHFKAFALLRELISRLCLFFAGRDVLQHTLFMCYVTEAVHVTCEFHCCYRYFHNNSAPYEFGIAMKNLAEWELKALIRNIWGGGGVGRSPVQKASATFRNLLRLD
jgi:hypothetical protein